MKPIFHHLSAVAMACLAVICSPVISIHAAESDAAKPAAAETKAKDAMAAPAPATKPDLQKKVEPNPALLPITDVAGLPRVLIIGDSISIGYTIPTRKLLEGKANVHRIPTNGGPTLRGVQSVAKWIGDGTWDVIHLNFGLHDLKYMPDGKRQVEPEAYEKNLREIVTKLKATGATVIWATTTPVPEGKLNPERRFGDVKVYNDIAAKVMKEMDVQTDDLNAAITPELAKLQNPQDVHFKTAGSEFLASKVAAEIEAALKERAGK